MRFMGRRTGERGVHRQPGKAGRVMRPGRWRSSVRTCLGRCGSLATWPRPAGAGAWTGSASMRGNGAFSPFSAPRIRAAEGLAADPWGAARRPPRPRAPSGSGCWRRRTGPGAGPGWRRCRRIWAHGLSTAAPNARIWVTETWAADPPKPSCPLFPLFGKKVRRSVPGCDDLNGRMIAGPAAFFRSCRICVRRVAVRAQQDPGPGRFPQDFRGSAVGRGLIRRP